MQSGQVRGCRRRLPRLAWPLLVLGLSACTVGPDYVEPDVAMPDAWHRELVAGLSEGESSVQTWWRLLEDPELEDLIARASANNLDLEVAFARIQEARAFRGIEKSQRYPDIQGFGSGLRRTVSENAAGLGSVPGFKNPNDEYTLGMDAAWELDLWGRITRSIQAADADMVATYENYRDVLVVLLGDVAANYVEVRALQARIRYAEANIRTQRGTLQLTRDRFNAQIAPELDVSQAQLNLASTEAALPFLEQLLAQSIHRLGVLLGEHPTALYGELDESTPIPIPPQVIAVGIPADILRQRPDIRRAERELAGQTARIGARTAELYPTFRLSGAFGLQARETNDLFNVGSKFWEIGVPFRWNLFNGGRIRNLINVEEARTAALLAVYQQTVLLALEEVENAMVAFVKESQRRDALARSVVAAQRSVELVKTLYTTGLTNFQNVLDMERSLTQRQDELAESEGRVTQNLVAMYRALGGGWQPDPEQLADEIRDQEEHGAPIF